MSFPIDAAAQSSCLCSPFTSLWIVSETQWMLHFQRQWYSLSCRIHPIVYLIRKFVRLKSKLRNVEKLIVTERKLKVWIPPIKSRSPDCFKYLFNCLKTASQQQTTNGAISFLFGHHTALQNQQVHSPHAWFSTIVSGRLCFIIWPPNFPPSTIWHPIMARSLVLKHYQRTVITWCYGRQYLASISIPSIISYATTYIISRRNWNLANVRIKHHDRPTI